jgi:hypothetical protein
MITVFWVAGVDRVVDRVAEFSVPLCYGDN